MACLKIIWKWIFFRKINKFKNWDFGKLFGNWNFYGKQVFNTWPLWVVHWRTSLSKQHACELYGGPPYWPHGIPLRIRGNVHELAVVCCHMMPLCMGEVDFGSAHSNIVQFINPIATSKPKSIESSSALTVHLIL